MNGAMIKRLMAKDLYFNRGMIKVYGIAGLLALLIIGIEGDFSFYLGSILFITVVVGLGIHLTMATVVHERKEKTLPFVMSLPITIIDYTVAKIAANLIIFIIPWTIFALGSVALILGRETLPNGLAPFALLVIGELFAAYCCILAVSLISESEGWTIGAIVATSIGLNVFIYGVSHIEAVKTHMLGAEAVWHPVVFSLFAVEFLVAILALGLTFYFQGRKTDFL